MTNKPDTSRVLEDIGVEEVFHQLMCIINELFIERLSVNLHEPVNQF